MQRVFVVVESASSLLCLSVLPSVCLPVALTASARTGPPTAASAGSTEEALAAVGGAGLAVVSLWCSCFPCPHVQNAQAFDVGAVLQAVRWLLH